MTDPRALFHAELRPRLVTIAANLVRLPELEPGLVSRALVVALAQRIYYELGSFERAIEPAPLLKEQGK